MHTLWFNFFKPVSFLFSFVSDYGNESETKENKTDETDLEFLNQKKIKPQHIYVVVQF